MTQRKRQRGVTLVELVLAIVVMGVAMAGLMVAYASVIGRSADPMIYQQSIAIADSMLEEIVSKAFPDSYTGTCPAPPGDRALFDDVCDYDGYTTTTIADVAGNDLGITGYSVLVDVSAAGSDLGVPANDMVRIDIIVGNPLGNDVQLSGYRARY